jgi:superfamily II DNA helicase RecQ
MSRPTYISNIFAYYLKTSSFKEKYAFKNIKELDFLSYYKDFKLILCSKCFIAINLNFISHLIKHLKDYSNKEKASLKSKAILVYNSLEVSSLKTSLDLIVLFSKHFNFQGFKELETKNLYICTSTSFCSIILSSEYSIKRHIREAHLNTSLSYKAIKGQALEINKYFFNFSLEANTIRYLDNSLESPSPSSSSLISINQAKEAFITSFTKKQTEFKASLDSFKLDPKEKLSPFQVKTRYIEYISRYNIQDLVDLIVPLNKEELVLEILVLNLKELLYLSLDKIVFLNKSLLNILNSFEDNKIRNKPFKPIDPSSRIRYFNFFSLFFIYFFRSITKSLATKISYFKISNNILYLYNSLIFIINNQLENQEDYLKTSIKAYTKRKTSTSLILNKLSIKNNTSFNELETSSISSFSSLESSNSSSISKSLDFSFTTSNNSSSLELSNSLESSLLESSNLEIIEQIKAINKSKDLISIEIKELILELIISLIKESPTLDIFSSSFNSFFATISIRVKDYSFKDSLELSQEYSKFIYSIQLVIVEYLFKSLILDSSLDLNQFLKEFRDKYLTNSSSSSLSEILNNRLYSIRVNKELSTTTFISISPTSKETLTYKTTTISVDNLRLLYNRLVSTSYNILVEKLLLNISKSKYKEITLEKYSKFEDRSLTSPFKCFRDLSPSLEANNNFIREEILNTTSLFKRFFIIEDLELKLNIEEVNIYLNSLLEFKKLCLLLVYLTSGLPLRGTELVTLKFLNSYKDKRELFLDISSNLFILNISYYKGQNISEKRATNIRYLAPNISKIFLLYIVLVDPFISFLNLNIYSIKKLTKTRSLVPYFFFTNNKLLESKDLSLKLASFSRLVLGFKLGIQVYRQVILTIIKEFMLERLNTRNLVLEEADSPLNRLVALGANHSLVVEDLHYGRTSLVFDNISSNLQYKYLSFCLRFFRYFQLESYTLDLDSFKNQLKIKNNLDQESSLSITSSLAIKYSKNSYITSQVNLESSKNGQVTVESSKNGQVTLEPSKNGQVTLEPGKNGPVTLEPSKNSPVTLQPSKNGPVTLQPSKNGQVTLEPSKNGQVTLEPSSLQSNSLLSSSLNKKHSRQASSISSNNTKIIKKIKTLDLINLSSLSSSTIVLTSLLQEFLDDSLARFKSIEQELLVQAILLKIPYILGVLPTSAGKSLSYLLTSALSISKITIVIIPLVGLKLDIVRRASEFNIPCNIFEETKSFNNLTLVSIETITSSKFQELVEDLIKQDKLDRIIIDECHLLISSASYRPIMYRLKEILRFKIQFIFLSGTLPFSFEQELKNRLFLDDLSCIRASSLRSNISYRARAYKSSSTKEEDKIREIQEYINKTRTKEFTSSLDKILIFCPSLSNIKLVASTLNCCYFDSSLELKEKQLVLANFQTKTSSYYSILVTSSSLEEGFNYSSIRLVIYKDIAYSFLGFLQGSSRGGRDNKPSISMFFYTFRANKLDQTTSISSTNKETSNLDILARDKLLVEQYLSELTCRIRQISLYLDNTLWDSCNNSKIKCDLCFNRYFIINNQASRVLEDTKTSEALRVEVQAYIVDLSVKCIYCSIIRDIGEKTNSNQHSSGECILYNNIEALSQKIKRLVSSKTIILAANSCCFKCLLPTVICSQIKKGEDCYNNKLIYRILGIYYIYRVKLRLVEKYRLSSSISIENFSKVLCKRVYISSIRSEGLAIFDEFLNNSK